MKTVITTPTVDLALRTLGMTERHRVHAWFSHLANWDGDPFVRDNSPLLPGVPSVRVFQTNSDTRIFFRIDGDTVTILDVAERQGILRTAAAGMGS
ncbi:MAG: hypothetical protein ACRC7O_04345 [Fimbriiglobus sp.]